MTIGRLAARSLTHRWTLSLLTLLCLALASSVLLGAFLVGDSIKSGLRNRLVEPLRDVTHAWVSPSPISAQRAMRDSAVLIRYDGSAQNDEEATLGGVTCWGIDESFILLMDSAAWRPYPGRAWVTAEVAQRLRLRVGDVFYLRLPDPKAPSAQAVFARKGPLDRTKEVKVKLGAVLPDKGMGRFDLFPNFGSMRGVFVSRSWLAQQLGMADGGNVAVGSSSSLVSGLTLQDFGLSLHQAKAAGGWALHSDSLVMPEEQVQATAQIPGSKKISIALADQIVSGARSASYGVAAWIEGEEPGVNEWAAQDLGWQSGAQIKASLLVSQPDGSYGMHEASALPTRTLPLKGIGGEPAFVPAISGVTEAKRVDDWDPPFPLDHERITQRDEDYWTQHRAAPRLLLSKDDLTSAWNGREAITAVWIPQGSKEEIEAALLTELGKSLPAGTVNLREAAVRAAQGSTDMTSLVLALGFFLLLSALGLAGSAFRLIVTHEAKSIALLTALGISQAVVRRVFILQGLLLGMGGSLLGVGGGILFADLSLGALGSLLPDTFPPGTLSLALSPLVMLACAVGSLSFVFWPVLAGLKEVKRLALVQTLRGGSPAASAIRPTRVWIAWAVIGAIGAGAGLSMTPPVNDLVTGIGVFCLVMGLASWSLGQGGRPRGTLSFTRLLWRHCHESRSSLLLIFFLSGMAAYMLASVAAQADLKGIRDSRLILRTSIPVEISLSTPEGRKRLGFTEEELKATEGIRVLPFLVGPGQDASCLNPAKPVKPRFIGLPYETAREHPFFMDPKSAWLTLTQSEAQNPAPALGDQDTVLWTLLSGVGKELPWEGDRRVKFTGLIKNSPLAREVMVSQADFQSVYPSITSPSLFVISPAKESPAALKDLKEALQTSLAPLGPEITSTAQEIAQLKRVQLSYMALFFVLGSLGLILGMAGSAFAAAREVAARRQQYALMRAIGLKSFWLKRLALYPGIIAGLGGTLTGLLCGGPRLFSGELGLLLVGLLAACIASISLSSLFVASQWSRDSQVEALRSE